MEVDIDKWVLTAAGLAMSWNGSLLDKQALVLAFDELYPETKIIVRYRKQLGEYKKLTMWRE